MKQALLIAALAIGMMAAAQKDVNLYSIKVQVGKWDKRTEDWNWDTAYAKRTLISISERHVVIGEDAPQVYTLLRVVRNIDDEEMTHSVSEAWDEKYNKCRIVIKYIKKSNDFSIYVMYDDTAHRYIIK